MGEKTYPFIPLAYQRLAIDEQKRRAREFLQRIRTRRTVRHFSPEPVALELIEAAVEAASTAPSGANQQPWKFVLVTNPEVKRRIREAAEAEERDNYERRFPDEWLDALRPLGTDWHKEFLEIAPCLIVVFRENWGVEPRPDGTTHNVKHYYVMESVGIAVGVLLAALHLAGLATLTHTPSPMGFLNEILERPANEKPYVVIPVGYPAPDAQVPEIPRKSLDEVMPRVE
ncbi:MAG: nitroreductase family protein [Candidatus Latescibacterota bacterium]|nr:MAG: nitroreductase family protein [Candidatus Latescibacterota bacterium]